MRGIGRGPVVAPRRRLVPPRRGAGTPARFLSAASVAAALALAGCAPAAASGGAPAEPAIAAATATYTAEQADLGERVFGGVCAVCHGATEFRGAMFELTWMAEPVGNFYQHISTAMPQDRPGTLAPREYAAIVAYVLRLNGRPPGDRELPADAEALATVGWGDGPRRSAT